MTPEKKPLRAVLFDFNGTLLFDDKMQIESFRKCFSAHGLPLLTEEEITAHVWGCSNHDIYCRYFNPHATDAEVAAFAKEKETFYMEACLRAPDRYHLAEGAAELLDHLKENGIPYCMVTGSPLCNIQFYFETLGIGRWFSMENIVYGDDTFPGKPAPDFYLRAAARLGVSPAECLVFEDGTSGILSARRAGCGGLVAIYEEGQGSPLTKEAYADRVIHDYTEWRDILTGYGIP